MQGFKKVPKLRFEGFQDEYERKEFGELVKKSSKIYNPNKDSTNYKCIELESLSQKTGMLLSTFDSVDLKSNKTKFKKGNVLFGKLRPYLKKFLLVDFDGVCTSEIWVFEAFRINNSYLFYLIQTDKFNYEANLTTGSKMPRADWDYVSSIRYSFPTLPEQEKIANFLTAVDAKISNLSEEKSLLEQYKKGAMQKIFSQELRFKQDDGSDFPKWENKRLGEVSQITMGQSPSSASYNTIKKGKYLIQGNADIKNRRTNPRNWTDEPTKECEVGDLILTVRAPVGAIAISNHNACIGRGVCAIKNTRESCLDFLYQFLLLYESKWTSLEQGSTFTAVSGKDIKSVSLKMPIKEEQIKIANFLSAIDEKIATVSEALEGAQAFKKGLLQQLFV